MRGRFWVWVACVGMGMVLVGPSATWGSLITFSDRAAFENTLGHFTKYGFEVAEGFPSAGADPPAIPIITGFGPVELHLSDATGVPFPTLAWEASVPGQTLWGWGVGTTLIMRFKSPQRGVGFELVGVPAGSIPNALVTLEHPTLPDDSLDVDSIAVRSEYRFFGVISSEAITGIVIDAAPVADGFSVGNGMDNFTISAVPEPGLPGLFLGVCAGFVRRRFRQAHAGAVVSRGVKRMRGRFLMCVFCVGMVAVLVGTSKARGSLITFQDRVSFERSLREFTKYSFEVADGFPAAPALITNLGDGRVQVAASAGGAAEIARWPQSDEGPSPGQFLGPLPVLTFTDGPTGVGFYGVSMGGRDARITLEFVGGAAQSFLWSDVGNPYNFLGVISTEPLRSILLRQAEGIHLPMYGVDDLTVGFVPEPGSAGLLLGACAGIALRRRIRVSSAG